jgi:hypothetical protein
VIDSNQHLIGVAGLARLLESGIGFSELVSRLEARVMSNPSDANALMDLSTLLFLTANPDYRQFAFARQQQALQISEVYRLPPRADPRTLRLLVLMAPGDMTANTPVDCLLEDSDIEVTLLYVSPGGALPSPLPNHDLIFVAIGQSDQSQMLLQHLAGLSGLSAKPLINAPEKIVQLTRDHVATILQSVPGAVVPASVRVGRQSLMHVGRGGLALTKVLPEGRFPIIVRPVDSHGGKDLAKIDSGAELLTYMARLSEKQFYVSNFIDYAAADGQFRKCRAVMFAGRAFACHLAISSHWMIHYFNADMAASDAKRNEEEQFMNDFDSFAERHKEALEALYRLIGLEYLVIDCAETRDGRLLVFEVDNAAIVHSLDDPQIFPYKLAQMRKVFVAFREMLVARVLDVLVFQGRNRIDKSLS